MASIFFMSRLLRSRAHCIAPPSRHVESHRLESIEVVDTLAGVDPGDWNGLAGPPPVRAPRVLFRAHERGLREPQERLAAAIRAPAPRGGARRCDAAFCED